MELIAAVLFAGPLGYLMKDPRKSLWAYLVLWAVIFPIQTVVVGATSNDLEPMYFAANTAILALGIGLNRLGARLGERRRTTAGTA